MFSMQGNEGSKFLSRPFPSTKVEHGIEVKSLYMYMQKNSTIWTCGYDMYNWNAFVACC